MKAQETISKNWRNKEPYEIELTQDQLELLEVGNVFQDGNKTTYMFPIVIERVDGKFYVTNIIRFDDTITQNNEWFRNLEKVKYTIEK